MLKESSSTRIEVPPYDEIPDSEAVASRRGIDSLEASPAPESRLLKLSQVRESGEFLFSPETVARREEFYKNVKKPSLQTLELQKDFFEFWCL